MALDNVFFLEASRIIGRGSSKLSPRGYPPLRSQRNFPELSQSSGKPTYSETVKDSHSPSDIDKNDLITIISQFTNKFELLYKHLLTYIFNRNNLNNLKKIVDITTDSQSK